MFARKREQGDRRVIPMLTFFDLSISPLQEKQKRDAEDKQRQIRKTIEEQEELQRRLKVQKEQSDSDSAWLKSEDVHGHSSQGENQGAPIERNLQYRHSFKEGVSKNISLITVFFLVFL